MRQGVLTPHDPEFYSELLYHLHRDEEEPWNPEKYFKPSGSDPSLPLDEAAMKRLYAVLDVLALVSVPSLHNAGAITISITQTPLCTIATTIYVVFTRQISLIETDNVVRHLNHIFAILRDIPAPGLGESSKILPPESRTAFYKLLTALYRYSWDVFMHHARKRQNSFQRLREDVMNIRGDIHPPFTDDEYLALEKLFGNIDLILEALNQCDPYYIAETICNVHKEFIQMGISFRGTNTKDNLLLEKLDNFMQHQEYFFIMQDWLSDIMSLHLAGLNLSGLALSARLRVLLTGTLTVEVLPTLQADLYSCELSPKNVKQALVQALEANPGVKYKAHVWQDDFTNTIADHAVNSDGTHIIHRTSPSVHCEISMIHHIRERKINVLRYIGGSELSCRACSVYMHACVEQFITRGTRWEFCPSWRLPISNSEDGCTIRSQVVKLLQGILVKDFIHWVNDQKMAGRRKSNDDFGCASSNGVILGFYTGALEAARKAKEASTSSGSGSR